MPFPSWFQSLQSDADSILIVRDHKAILFVALAYECERLAERLFRLGRVGILAEDSSEPRDGAPHRHEARPNGGLRTEQHVQARDFPYVQEHDSNALS